VICIMEATGDIRSDGQFCHACKVCGVQYWSKYSDPAKIRRACPATRNAMFPPLGKRLANFTVAAIGHAMAGAPTCTDDEIAARLAICRGCTEFRPDKDNPEIGACGKCGCHVSGLLPKFVSKLAWADQHCPLGKW
jgi:hypothetical protein